MNIQPPIMNRGAVMSFKELTNNSKTFKKKGIQMKNRQKQWFMTSPKLKNLTNPKLKQPLLN